MAKGGKEKTGMSWSDPDPSLATIYMAGWKGQAKCPRCSEATRVEAGKGSGGRKEGAREAWPWPHQTDEGGLEFRKKSQKEAPGSFLAGDCS